MALPATLTKQERLCSKKLIDTLFNGSNSHSLAAFPLRAVYMPLEDRSPKNPTDSRSPKNPTDPRSPGSPGNPTGPAEPSQMLISVPKRYFHRAVKRNRVKRQVREAYRRNKQLLDGTPVVVAFIWLADKLYSSPEVENRVHNLLARIKEKMRYD